MRKEGQRRRRNMNSNSYRRRTGRTKKMNHPRAAPTGWRSANPPLFKLALIIIQIIARRGSTAEEDAHGAAGGGYVRVAGRRLKTATASAFGGTSAVGGVAVTRSRPTGEYNAHSDDEGGGGGMRPASASRDGFSSQGSRGVRE
ncbi:unnamed protein product, partial [Pylaiella littoralis]